jgi:hypothetical protein
MRRIILEIIEINLDRNSDNLKISVTGKTRSQPYKDPELVFTPSIPEKDQILELGLEFFADDEGAIFQAIGVIDASTEINLKDYPNLKSIIVTAEDNSMTVTI